MQGSIGPDPGDVGESIHKAFELLHPVTRRRLFADQACEMALLVDPYDSDIVASNLRQLRPWNLPNYMYLHTVVLSAENALETYVEQVTSDQIKDIANEYRNVVEDAQIRYSEGKWREAMCSLNSKRDVVDEYIHEHCYDCSAEEWVDTCELIWKEDFDTVLSYVDPEYLNSLLAERCSTTMTVEDQADELADIFRAIVAGGNVRFVPHDRGLQWAGAHIKNVNQAGIESFI